MCWLGVMHVCETGMLPEIFIVGTNPLATYNLSDFKNYVMKIK